MKSKACIAAFISIAALSFSISVSAQPVPRSAGLSTSVSPMASASAAPTTSSTKQTLRPLPFHGMVAAVDQKNKTFTISGKVATRVFRVTDKTVITKGAGSAKFSDVAYNQEVSGAYWKNTDGSLEAKLVKVGPMEKKSPNPAAKPSPSASPRSSATPSP